MAFIDVVEWSPRSNDIYAWRFPHSNLSTATQLIVHESQEAVFFSKGQILGKFGPGKHQLTTQNLPLLRNLYGIPFGGKNPFMAEVWFVNRTMPLNIDWHTTSMRYMDPEYGAMVPLVAQGRYGVQVQQSEKFLVKLIGTMESFSSTQLTDHFMGPLSAKTNSAIMSFMSANRVGITQVAAHLDQLSSFVKQPMEEFWDEYGLRLTSFYITSIDIDTSSSEGRKISEALSDRSAQNIAGYTWQQRQSFDVAQGALNSNSNMGLLGVAMMGGLFSQGGGAAQSMMQQPQQTGFGAGPGFGAQGGYAGGQGFGAQGGYASAQGGFAPQGPTPRRAQVFCANCAKPFPADSRFCPNCGHEINPCPVCGADNQTGARRCVTCGAQLTQSNTAAEAGLECPRCHAPAKPGVKFCNRCGARLDAR